MAGMSVVHIFLLYTTDNSWAGLRDIPGREKHNKKLFAVSQQLGEKSRLLKK